MKKFLLTASLVLALVVSLTAGTMAYYYQEVDTIEGTITNKTFNIIADQNTGSFNQKIKIAPGDTVKYLVTVENDSEVKTDVTVHAFLTTSYEGMSVTVEHLGDGTTDTGENSATVEKEMAIEGSGSYEITVAWAYGPADNTDDAGDSTVLKIDIHGQQVDDDQQHYTGSTAKD